MTNVIQLPIITKLVDECYNESDIDKKVKILYKINSLLPMSCSINIPSLITDDYVDTALYRIEKRIHRHHGQSIGGEQ